MDGRYGGNDRRKDDGEGGLFQRNKPGVDLGKREDSEPARNGNDGSYGGNDGYSGERPDSRPRDLDRDASDRYPNESYRNEPYRGDPYRGGGYPNGGGGRVRREDYVPSGLSPWRGVWLHPRLVTRDFLHASDPLRNALWLALAAGVLNAMDRASGNSQGDNMTMLGLVFVILAAGALSGLVTYYFGSWLLQAVGKWVGGVGTTEEMRIVSGRIVGMLTVTVGLFWIPELLIAGREAFTTNTPVLDDSLWRALLYSAIVGIESLFGIWAFVLTLHAIGEIHGFSAWRALLVLILSGIMVALAILLIGVVVAMVFGGLFAFLD